MAEKLKRNFGVKVGDAISDIVRYATGTATPGQIRQERRLEALQPEINELTLARQRLENEQISNAVEALKQQYQAGQLTLDEALTGSSARGGLPREDYQFFQTTLPESQERVKGMQLDQETALAGREDLKKLSGGSVSTPAGASYDIGKRQVSASLLDPLTMLEQILPGTENEMARLSILTKAGLIPADEYENRLKLKQEADAAKLKAILNPPTETKKGKTSAQLFPPSLLNRPDVAREEIVKTRTDLINQQLALEEKLKALGVDAQGQVPRTYQQPARGYSGGIYGGYVPPQTTTRSTQYLGQLQQKADEYAQQIRELQKQIEATYGVDPIEYLKSLQSPQPTP